MLSLPRNAHLARLTSQSAQILNHDDPRPIIGVTGPAGATGAQGATGYTGPIVSADAGNSITASGTDGGAYFASPIKAFGKVAGSGTGSGLFNATIGHPSTGTFTITFGTAMSNSDYVIQLTPASSEERRAARDAIWAAAIPGAAMML